MKKNIADGMGLWWKSGIKIPFVAWMIAIALVPAIANAHGPIVSATVDWLDIVIITFRNLSHII